jgi:hypothetical protein
MAIKIVLFFIMISFSSYKSISQTSMLSLRDFELARSYTLCNCVQHLYKKLDSTGVYNLDYSTSYFLQMSNLTYHQMQKLDSILDHNINDYILTPQEKLPNNKANMVVISCINFCNSKKFKSYFRK